MPYRYEQHPYTCNGRFVQLVLDDTGNSQHRPSNFHDTVLSFRFEIATDAQALKHQNLPPEQLLQLHL